MCIQLFQHEIRDELNKAYWSLLSKMDFKAESISYKVSCLLGYSTKLNSTVDACEGRCFERGGRGRLRDQSKANNNQLTD